MTNTVMVAMSGGVDSAVVAYLVKQQGYNTIAATMKIGHLYDIKYDNCCCSDQNVADAKKMSDSLGIEHFTIDLTDKFREFVSDHFIQTYLQGDTPNPCVECNRYIKFGHLLDFATSHGAKKIATGHYAAISEQNGRYLLCRSNDPAKDQTYMLWKLTQEQLSRTIFPLSSLNKREVKEIAAQLKIIAAEKKESQDICFIPDGDYASFIKSAIKYDLPQGHFKDTNGNILGPHRGIIHYTPGQRKGLGISFGEPMYVKSKSSSDNSVVLCRADELFTKRITANQINIIPCDNISAPMRVTAKIRYSQSESSATLIQTDKDEITLEFDQPQRAVSPGQSVVMYDGDVVIGGGIIK